MIETEIRKALESEIGSAQGRFAHLIRRYLEHSALTVSVYQRYLSMQYHLTRGVQEYFFRAAGHADLCKMKRLRRFLLEFANEEELHYLVAAKDLEQLELAVLPEPFDVELWHAYFRNVVLTRPFIRLGAAVVLESIAGGAAEPHITRALRAPFLNRGNTNFLVLHRHERQPHGEQLMDALCEAHLSDGHMKDLLLGARRGGILYLRMAEASMFPEADAALAQGSEPLSSLERDKIARFSMSDLQVAA